MKVAHAAASRETRQKAAKVAAVLQGRMTAADLADATGLSKQEIGFAVAVLVQEGLARRISLKPPRYYPIAYERREGLIEFK